MAGAPLLARIRRHGAPAAKRLLFSVGAYAAVRKVRPSSQLAILRYHAICGPEGDAYAEPGICVTPESFEQHVAYLSSRYRVLPLAEAVACLRSGRSLPNNAVAITFDDGYADNLAAAGVLARYGLNATFYITAGCISGESPFWPSEIRHLLARITTPRLRLRVERDVVVIPFDTPTEQRAALRSVSKLFKGHRIAVREDLREQLRYAAGMPSVPSYMLTWDQLRQMQRLGMTIGAHTLTHPNLPSAGLADAVAEITGSRQRLEHELGVQVTMFSYPNGGAERYYTSELQRVVREAGFDAATTSRNGFAGQRSDLYALERVQVAERLEDLAFALEVERFAFRPQERSHARD